MDTNSHVCGQISVFYSRNVNKTVYEGKSMGSHYNYCQQGPLINKKETLW